jgi:hypothetical protein
VELNRYSRIMCETLRVEIAGVLSMPARIYPFPARGRFAAKERSEQSRSDCNFSPARVTNVVFGNAWYHDEAVEAERAEKNEKNK